MARDIGERNWYSHLVFYDYLPPSTSSLSDGALYVLELDAEKGLRQTAIVFYDFFHGGPQEVESTLPKSQFSKNLLHFIKTREAESQLEVLADDETEEVIPELTSPSRKPITDANFPDLSSDPLDDLLYGGRGEQKPA